MQAHYPCLDRFLTRCRPYRLFTRLPEAWGGEPEGAYSTGGVLPPVPTGVTLHQGLFSETLPPFLAQASVEGRPVALANVDCDLYTATRDVLFALGRAPGAVQAGATVLVFDEWFMYEGWREDEAKAFFEAARHFGWEYEFLAWSFASKQAALKITAVGSRAAKS